MSGGGPLRIGAIDDHPAILHGVMAGLVSLPPAETSLAVSASVDDLLAEAPQLDVVLLDMSLGDASVPADNVRRLMGSGHRVLLYTQETRSRPVLEALQAGAMGIVGKHQELSDLADAVLEVAAGEIHLSHEWAAVVEAEAARLAPHLSARETEALELYAAGLPLKSVARRMSLSAETVRVYLLRVRQKYEAVGRPAVTKTDLYIRAVEDGYLPPPETT